MIGDEYIVQINSFLKLETGTSNNQNFIFVHIHVYISDCFLIIYCEILYYKNNKNCCVRVNQLFTILWSVKSINMIIIKVHKVILV